MYVHCSYLARSLSLLPPALLRSERVWSVETPLLDYVILLNNAKSIECFVRTALFCPALVTHV